MKRVFFFFRNNNNHETRAAYRWELAVISKLSLSMLQEKNKTKLLH